MHRNEMTEALNFRDAGFIILIIKDIYIDKCMYKDESRWLKCSKAEDEQCSMAGGSLLPTCVNPCARVYQ
jgi:hypothetical protein